jgi:phosphate transport system permease protein
MMEGGIGPALLGTIGVTLWAAALAVPVGVGAALWLNQVAQDGPGLRLVRLSLRNLAGIPSIVYGLFGVALFVHGLGLGLSMLSSGLTLGLLTLPWTITASEEALKTVPRSLRDGALALGATRWEAMTTVLLPSAAPGILTGVILGLARAAGETAPLLFTGVTFYAPHAPSSPLDQYMALPYHLYVLATQHNDLEAVRPRAYGTALVLVGLVAGLSLGTAALRARLRGLESR